MSVTDHMIADVHFPFRLLRVQALFCNLVGAQKTYEQTLTLIDDLKAINQAPHLAGIYADFSFYFFTKNEFHEVLIAWRLLSRKDSLYRM